MRILFVPTYRHDPGSGSATASDALGFGVTCSAALLDGLRLAGLDVRVLPVGPAGTQTRWLASALRAFDRAMAAADYDAVLAFHAFWPFTADLRRIMDDRGRHCALVTYTHGSHWDPTDLFRFERYPDLRWADLGNLLAADRVLTVSRYMTEMLVRTVRLTSREAAAELEARIRTAGLPLDIARIDAAPRLAASGPPIVVFNHAMIAAKRPGIFLALAADLLETTSARILITRRVPATSPWSNLVADLGERYPGRVLLGHDLPVDEYYSWLWASSVQVSTAVHESLGVATLEAMATRTFCLLPRTGAYPETADGDPEVLYGDPADLRARLASVVSSHAAAAAAASAAARHAARVRAGHAPERVARVVADIIAEAVDAR